MPARASGATAPAGKGSFSAEWWPPSGSPQPPGGGLTQGAISLAKRRPKAGGPQPPAAKARNSWQSMPPFAGCVRMQIENGKWEIENGMRQSDHYPLFVIHCCFAAPAAQPVATPGGGLLSRQPARSPLRWLRSENAHFHFQLSIFNSQLVSALAYYYL